MDFDSFLAKVFTGGSRERARPRRAGEHRGFPRGHRGSPVPASLSLCELLQNTRILTKAKIRIFPCPGYNDMVAHIDAAYLGGHGNSFCYFNICI